jgi:hypothetical protein
MVELVVATTPFQIVVINTKLRQHKMQQHYKLTIETHALNFVKLGGDDEDGAQTIKWIHLNL